LRVRLGNAAFGGGNVGTAFEQLRRNAKRNGDRFCGQRIDGDGK
jgi:hypothetical protein